MLDTALTVVAGVLVALAMLASAASARARWRVHQAADGARSAQRDASAASP